MRVTVTGATGLIGPRLVRALQARGDDVTVLSRRPGHASQRLGVTAVGWDPMAGAAPASALAGRDAVVHLAGEQVAQRWTRAARRAILDSRVTGTTNLIAGIAAAEPRPRTLVSSSAIGYYGPHGDEPLAESDPPGDDFLANVTVAWERAAEAARGLGLRIVKLRTGVVLDPAGGALAKMLPPFRAGVGGPVAGGRQYVSWIHADDLVGMALAALDDERWQGAANATAPDPVTNRKLARALGRALHRPAVVPVPALALRLLYGQMAQIVTTGQRAMPTVAARLGYRFQHPELDEALADALS